MHLCYYILGLPVQLLNCHVPLLLMCLMRKQKRPIRVNYSYIFYMLWLIILIRRSQSFPELHLWLTFWKIFFHLDLFMFNTVKDHTGRLPGVFPLHIHFLQRTSKNVTIFENSVPLLNPVQLVWWRQAVAPTESKKHCENLHSVEKDAEAVWCVYVYIYACIK